MERFVSELKRAYRFYDDNEEERTIEMVDSVLGISHLSPADALRKLQQWPKQYTLPEELEVTGSPTGWLLMDSEYEDKPLHAFGFLGLLDAMRLRSLALSSIIFGPSAEKSTHYAICAFQNAQLVMQLYKDLRYGEEGALWCLSAQPTMLAKDPEIVEMGFGMINWAVEKFPELATHSSNQYLFYNIMPEVYTRCKELPGIQFYWDKLVAAFEQAKASHVENATSSFWLIQEILIASSAKTPC